MAEDLGERTEDPTTRRRTDAREEGNVARSQDLASAGLLFAVFVLMLAFGGSLFSGMAGILRRMLDPALSGDYLMSANVLATTVFVAEEVARLLIPLLVLLAIAAYIMQFVQVGWLFTFKPLKPKLNKLNLVAGMKKLFSSRKFVKGGIDTLKFLVVASIAAAFSLANMGKIIALPGLETQGIILIAGSLILQAILWLLLVLFAIAIIDFSYQRWKYKEDLKMTKQEVKDERKTAEGDPKVKAQRLRMYSRIVQQQIQAAVPKADVVVTNPTHFSIALKYDASKMNAPKVVAKGADHVAIRIRLMAAAHGVPILERPPLARALYYNVEVGREIPVEYFEPVAEVLAYVYRLEGRAAS